MADSGFVFSDLRQGNGILDVDELAVAEGERLIVFGPNGAGKTTLLRRLADQAGARATYLPQRPYMFRGSGLHNLRLGLGRSEWAVADSLAAALGVFDRLDGPAGALSGGERHRLALARALAREAPLVLLDEPLAPLDVRDREAVIEVVADGIGGRAAVIVTHDSAAAAMIGGSVAVMLDGSIRQTGTVGEVFSLPEHEDVAEAVGVQNVLSGVVRSQRGALVQVDCGEVEVWALGDHVAGDIVRVLFGAEAVTVFAGSADRGSARNLWKGVVSEIRTLGRLSELVVDAGPTLVALITPGSLDALDLHPGSSISLTLKATAARAVAAPRP